MSKTHPKPNQTLRQVLRAYQEENAKLRAELEAVNEYKNIVYNYVQCTGNTSPKTLGLHVADALVMDHKDLKVKLAAAEIERDKALAELKKIEDGSLYREVIELRRQRDKISACIVERDQALADAKAMAEALETVMHDNRGVNFELAQRTLTPELREKYQK